MVLIQSLVQCVRNSGGVGVCFRGCGRVIFSVFTLGKISSLLAKTSKAYFRDVMPKCQHCYYQKSFYILLHKHLHRRRNYLVGIDKLDIQLNKSILSFQQIITLTNC